MYKNVTRWRRKLLPHVKIFGAIVFLFGLISCGANRDRTELSIANDFIGTLGFSQSSTENQAVREAVIDLSLIHI